MTEWPNQGKITKYNMKWNIINQRKVSKSQKTRPKVPLFSKELCLAVLVACLACVVAGGGESEPATAESQWMDAYTAMTEGNGHWALDEFVEAVECYRRAVAGFAGLRRNFPEWRADVVAFRLEYCRTKLADCEGRTGDNLEALPKEELLRLLRLERERSARLSETLRTIRADNGLVDLRADEIRHLREEKDALALEVEKLNRQLEALKGIAEKYDKARRELADLLMEYEDYKEKHGNNAK